MSKYILAFEKLFYSYLMWLPNKILKIRMAKKILSQWYTCNKTSNVHEIKLK